MKHTSQIFCIAVGSALLMFACIKEYDRLSYGFRLDLLKYSGVTLRSNGYTHAAGPELSLCANGDIEGINFLYAKVLGQGRIAFKSAKPIQYKLRSTLKGKEYEDDVGPAPRTQMQVDKSVILSKQFLQAHKLAADGSFCVKVTGVYFVAYLKIDNAKSLPPTAYVSLIVN